MASSRDPPVVALLIRSLRYPSARPLLHGGREHMEFFCTICAPEFSLFYELSVWETINLQGTLVEPALHYAALAIGSLSRSRYYPDLQQTSSAIHFSIRQYGLAIQALYYRLDGSSHALELAI